ncbi:hypothetical protein HK405_001845, partial [Cladochytrium tenue]
MIAGVQKRLSVLRPLSAHVNDEEEADLPDLAAHMRLGDQDQATRLFLAVKCMAPGHAAVLPTGNEDIARVVREADAKLREGAASSERGQAHS